MSEIAIAEVPSKLGARLIDCRLPGLPGSGAPFLNFKSRNFEKGYILSPYIPSVSQSLIQRKSWGSPLKFYSLYSGSQ